MENRDSEKEFINCLQCHTNLAELWKHENGFDAVKCCECGLIYVNPRPSLSLISEAVKTGVHSDVEHDRTAISRRVGSKVKHYEGILKIMFKDVWENKKSISWLDVGAGYGEVVEAVSKLSQHGSKVVGLEPMKPKADDAKNRGLNIMEMNLSDINEKYEFISIINVFSHIPDFRVFLSEIKGTLTGFGEVLIETGNTGDLRSHHEVPGDLDLPDHLVFAGEKNLVDYLVEAGFSIVCIRKMRTDGFETFIKNIVKKILGRKVSLSLPYTSKYRSILVRAKLTEK